MRRLLILIALLAPAAARANPHDLPFSYPYATLPTGALEVEQYTDLTPVQAVNGSTPVPSKVPAATLVTEIEYGITDNLELGLYFQASDNPGELAGAPNASGTSTGLVEAPLNFDGIKERLRYRIGHAGQWPVDTSVYFEVSEFQTEIELEGKINLEKDFGRFQFLINLWGEREFYTGGVQQWVANPTGGFSYQLLPSIHLGIEYWMHGEFGGPTGFNSAVHQYVGPAVMFQSTHFWVAAAPYVRLDQPGEETPVGGLYGPIWIRTIIGIEF